MGERFEVGDDQCLKNKTSIFNLLFMYQLIEWCIIKHPSWEFLSIWVPPIVLPHKTRLLCILICQQGYWNFLANVINDYFSNNKYYNNRRNDNIKMITSHGVFKDVQTKHLPVGYTFYIFKWFNSWVTLIDNTTCLGFFT